MTTQGDLASLYPFLEDNPVTEVAEPVMSELVRSTVAKLHESRSLRRRVLAKEANRLRVCGHAMAARLVTGGAIFVFGNGGSSTDAASLASLFTGSDGRSTHACAAIALTSDTATTTALANDIGYENALARQLATLASPSDIAIAISTSGSSENLLRALDRARRVGMLRVGLAGYEGGRFTDAGLFDHLFVVPSSSVHRIQEAQAALCHELWRSTVRTIEAGGGR